MFCFRENQHSRALKIRLNHRFPPKRFARGSMPQDLPGSEQRCGRSEAGARVLRPTTRQG